MVKHSSVTGVLELSGALTTGLDLDRERQTLLLMIKPNNIIAVFFFFFFFKILFNYVIQDIPR